MTKVKKNTKEEEETQKLKDKCEEYLAGWQRAKADYLNLKKETDTRTKEMIQYANAALLSDLIGVYNNFKLAFSHFPKNEDKEWENWKNGIGHIHKQMKDFIEKFGITEIKTVGEKFDPQFHESIGEEDTQEFESGIITKEVNPGYMLHDKLLVPAKVITAK